MRGPLSTYLVLLRMASMMQAIQKAFESRVGAIAAGSAIRVVVSTIRDVVQGTTVPKHLKTQLEQ
jgi:hypothetical protein